MNELATNRSLFSAPLAEIKEFSAIAIKSALVSGIKTPEQAMVIIATGLELGLQPMQALRGIHLIEGKPSLSAPLILALAKRHPECLYFRLVESSATKAVYETQRKGDPTPTRKTWTIEDAQRAGLAGKGTWSKHPMAMLEARCSAALARAVYADALFCVYTDDEGEEIRQSSEDKGRVIDMPAPTPTVEPTDEELLAKYQRVIAAASNDDELKQTGQRLAKEPKELQDAVRPIYMKRREELKSKGMQPSDYDRTEKEQAEKKSAREAIEQARANAQHHPPLSVAAAELLKQAGEINTQGDAAAVVNRKDSIHLTPAESKAIDEALRRRREALVQAQNSTTPDLLDPKF